MDVSADFQTKYNILDMVLVSSELGTVHRLCLLQSCTYDYVLQATSMKSFL